MMTSNPRVTVNQGVIEGLAAVTDAGKQYFSFRGIPFAKPPLGELRFKPPVPHPPWTGVKDATKNGSSCVQIDHSTQELSGSEDCLFLNVFTPQLPSKNAMNTPLPVMVFIHGGGFVSGSGTSEEFGPDFIVEQDTILVTINYRLGPLGFFCLDIPDAPGNMGLRDQNFALKWVQENIGFFNGDHNNVTIFGISAGSASVEFHIISPMSKGLFHKTILQSGSVLNPWAITRHPLALIEKVKTKLGVDINDVKEVLKYFKNMDAEELVRASVESIDEQNYISAELCAFTPVVEKNFEGLQPFLNEMPVELLKTGRFSKVPTITGVCEDEGQLFCKFFYEPAVGRLTEEVFIKFLPPSFKVDRKKYEKIIKSVYKREENNLETHVYDYISDMGFIGGIYVALMNRIKFTPEGQNYLYMFSYSGNLNVTSSLFDPESTTRALHGDDQGYLGRHNLIDHVAATTEDKLVRERLVKMWTNFAKTGNPTPELSPIIREKWLPITNERKLNMMTISKDLQMEVMPWKQRMDMWENLYKHNT